MVLGSAVAIGLLACLLLGRSAERLLRAGRPAQVVVVLAVSSVLLALGTGIAVGAVALASLSGMSHLYWSACPASSARSAASSVSLSEVMKC